MPGRNYYYQYDTSPRKIKPDYERERKRIQKKKPVKKVQTKKKIGTTSKINTKAKPKTELKSKVHLIIKCFLIFAILFLIILRNSQMNESFATIQNLKAQMTEIQKQNDQLEVSIQNSLNLNNIEQAAKEKLGMQKLTNKQTVYINLSKKDYVEPKSEKVILEEEKNIIENIIEKIKNIF